mgnify:CR=1 FL=1
MLAAATIAIVRVRNLFAVAVLFGIYSFLMAGVLIALDAVDVAMTEASVGAGVSTVLMLGTLYLTKTEESKPLHSAMLPLFVAGVTGAALIWGVSALPPFGEANTALQVMGPDYMDRSVKETGIPNVVTAVLGSYRGYDTLGETTVIFTAGIAVFLLLRKSSGRKRREND